MPFTAIKEFIQDRIVYPMAIASGWVGDSLGLGKHIEASRIIEELVDGLIGLVFVVITVVLTHYTRKYLRKCDIARSKKKKQKLLNKNI